MTVAAMSDRLMQDVPIGVARPWRSVDWSWIGFNWSWLRVGWPWHRAAWHWIGLDRPWRGGL
jgi:hypothetical protein